jgi:D-glycero-D-manno-heptose 1,7-bisphosphate phosphatase
MTTKNGAVIFDRDGVLNLDVGFAHRPDQIVWTEGAAEAVRAVNAAGLKALVATNQSGVARGYFDEARVVALHDWMTAELAAAGARIDGFVYCADHPDAPSERRKPGPGMVLELIAAFDLDPARTVLIGDQARDLEAARAAGIEGVLFAGGSLLEAVGAVLARIAAAPAVTGRPS